MHANQTTYAGDIRMPVVKGQKILDQIGHNGDFILGVVVHHLLRQDSAVRLCTVVMDLLVDEAQVVGLQAALSDQGVIRSPVREELHRVTGDGVAGVILDRVVVPGLGAVLALGRIGHIVRVAERTVVDGVV